MTEEDLNQAKRHKSYDLTQRLVFFVIGIEVVFCGYLLLNVEHFSKFNHLKCIFFISGISAFLGIASRFSRNFGYHLEAHQHKSIENKRFRKFLAFLILFTHWAFVLFSTAFFICILYYGSMYIDSFEAK